MMMMLGSFQMSSKHFYTNLFLHFTKWDYPRINLGAEICFHADHPQESCLYGPTGFEKKIQSRWRRAGSQLKSGTWWQFDNKQSLRHYNNTNDDSAVAFCLCRWSICSLSTSKIRLIGLASTLWYSLVQQVPAAQSGMIRIALGKESEKERSLPDETSSIKSTHALVAADVVFSTNMIQAVKIWVHSKLKLNCELLLFTQSLLLISISKKIFRHFSVLVPDMIEQILIMLEKRVFFFSFFFLINAVHLSVWQQRLSEVMNSPLPLLQSRK